MDAEMSGKARLDWGFAALTGRKKRGVPRRHENMPPGNSFPQICVVSVCENALITK
jgi:hypothetical protein